LERNIRTMSKFSCLACNRSYSNIGNLNKHLKSSVVCKKWLDLELDKKRNKKTIWESIDNLLDKQEGDKYLCKYCNKKFSTQSNLNKHMRSSVICTKWNNLSNIQELAEQEPNQNLLQDISPYNNFINSKQEFISPTDNLTHIIWNIYLCDKYEKITSETITNNKIGRIIAILPNKSDYSKYIDVNLVDYNVIEYHDKHTIEFNPQILKCYNQMCDRIEYQRGQQNRNTLIFCNNGYQRSLPFICYYLMRHHPEEFKTIESVITTIVRQLPQYKFDDLVKSMNKLKDLFSDIIEC
jgi:transcription elongation factor Elf1